MKATVNYRCDNCKTTFPEHCGVPDEMANATVKHGCPDSSVFSGVAGIHVSYMCVKCGHITKADITTMIPAMSTRKHGCGEVCHPA